MGGSGKGGSSAPNNNIFGQNPGGGGGGGNSNNVNVMRPGGGKPMPSTRDSNIPWPRRVTGEQQPQSQSQGSTPGGGKKGVGYWSTPEAIALAKKMAMGAAVGAPFGPGGTAIGTGVAYWREKAKQRELRENAQHIYAGTYKNTSPAGNPRAGTPGRPAASFRSTFSGFNPQDLLTSQASVKSKGLYQGPVRNSGGGGSLLGGDEFEEEGR